MGGSTPNRKWGNLNRGRDPPGGNLKERNDVLEISIPVFGNLAGGSHNATVLEGARHPILFFHYFCSRRNGFYMDDGVVDVAPCKAGGPDRGEQ